MKRVILAFLLAAAGWAAEDPIALLQEFRSASRSDPYASEAFPETALLERFQAAMGPWLQQALADPRIPRRPAAFAAWLKTRFAWRSSDRHPLGEIAFRTEERPGGWLLVVMDTSVPCGSDAQMYVFRNERLVWTDAAQMDCDLAKARWMQQFATLSSRRGLRLALFHVSPWCQSAWRVGTLRIVDIHEDIKVLHESRHGIWIGGDEPVLEPTPPDGFQVSFVARSLDAGRGNRSRILRYRIQGASVERVPPFASTPEDLVEEWASLPWEGTMPVADAPHDLRAWHQRIRSGDWLLVSGPGPRGVVYAPWDPASKTWTVALEPMDGPERVVFTVGKVHGALRLLKVRTMR